MFAFILIMGLSLFMMYYSLAYMGIFPYFEVLKNVNNMYFSFIHGTFAKWGIVFGVLMFLFSVFGLKFVELEDSKFNEMTSVILIVSVIYSFILIL